MRPAGYKYDMVMQNETTDARGRQFGPLNQALAGQTLELRRPFVARGPLFEKR